MSLKFFTRTIGKIALFSIFSVSLIALFIVAVTTHQLTLPSSYSAPAFVGAPGALSTDTWGIFDPETGKLLVGNNVEQKLPIASVTKLFTAESVLASKKKDEQFSILYNDVLTEGRAGKLAYGETVTPYQLLFPLLIESSNDAAVAIERKLGSDFSTSITHITNTLSLTNTEIAEPSGLSPKNLSTVQDLSTFYAYLRKTHPHIIDITQLNTYVGPKTGYINNDPARTLATFTGGKHGYTEEANRTFVGTFVRPDGKGEIGIVLLKSDNLLEDIETLLAYNGR